MKRKYLTPDDEKYIKAVFNSNKKQHEKTFAVEDYCAENNIDYNRVSGLIDSFRFMRNASGLISD